MNSPSSASPLIAPSTTNNYWLWGVLIGSIGLLFVIYWSGLSLMVTWWGQEEYSHGYMIPFVALFLVWQRINLLPEATKSGSWIGVGLLCIGLLLFFVGELSALYTLIQYGFFISFTAILWSFFGTKPLVIFWAALFYLIFMIPLPNFLYFNLSSQLQLISSVLGVAIIRLFDISVNLEGNVIDLGAMQLQVAEACSGLRYLFPLMSFGFLVGYLYRGAVWQRIAIFLSTLPITVVMNSLRIGLIGVTVDKWGIEMAEGFLHDFEGWVVFMGCITLLFLEIVAFQLFSKKRRSIADLIYLEIPRVNIQLSNFRINQTAQRPAIFSALLLLCVTPYFISIGAREEISPSRQQFINFPINFEGWVGREGALEKNIIDTLKFSDYITADYQRGSDNFSINFYSAWYESQKKGASIHSPRSCIPGGGWRIQNIDQYDIPGVTRLNGEKLRVNRALIQKGNSVNVVYYWFEGRDRVITNEYLAKWFIFWDALTRSRTDGALIRVLASVPDGASTDKADMHLQEFLQDFYPLIPKYVP